MTQYSLLLNPALVTQYCHLITLFARSSVTRSRSVYLPDTTFTAIIQIMALPKKTVPMGEPFHAVFENGVLRPLRPLRLKQKSRVLITLYPEPRWRSDFERLLTRMKSRTKAVPQEVVEAEITRARDDVKTKRRAARRSA
jgi:predicted DNA-binding antitoxin AbrB/MazE fold protein